MMASLCCRAQALGHLGSMWVQHVGSVVVGSGLWSTGSMVVVHGHSNSSACGIFLDQGSNLCLLHWQVDSVPLSHQGSPEKQFFKNKLGRNKKEGKNKIKGKIGKVNMNMENK